MIRLIDNGVYLVNGRELVENDGGAEARIREYTGKGIPENAWKGTISHGILAAHHDGEPEKGSGLRLKFDALASHDITYVGIVQTARASGLTRFPVPYVLTNCHNSLCAVGGTINEDDHVFGLSAAKKYGGIFVPPHIAVIHQYMRERMAGCGKMILGSDSHTRYGALGTMAVGEGGPELVKQILGKTYDVAYPGVVAVVLKGSPRHGVGPQDVALAIIREVFSKGFVKNKVMEFVGEGIGGLSVDFRSGVDVMTTETACLSSIWETDGKVKEYYEIMGRAGDYRRLAPAKVAYYDAAVVVELDKISPMIALPFHPSNAYEISDVQANPTDVLREAEKRVAGQLENPDLSLKLTDKVRDGSLFVQQGVIAGCAGGTYENIVQAARILGEARVGAEEFSLSVYPASQPVYAQLIAGGEISRLILAGAVVKTAFCGPCFGAGDVPANNALSIRHTTRNFPSREGSKPGQGQLAAVALMDARSIAATAANGGRLTAATELDYDDSTPKYVYDDRIYAARVYVPAAPLPETELKFGPNIADWPKQIPLAENVVLKVVSAIFDPVTTTDELIPSGETSSYRSNPEKLSEFALSRKDPGYVGRAKAARAAEAERREGRIGEELTEVFAAFGADPAVTCLGSAIYAVKPGDGSAREQAASCQRVLGGLANIAEEYATKRYRSNLINWGMLPLIANSRDFAVGDYLYLSGVAQSVKSHAKKIPALRLREGKLSEIQLELGELTSAEAEIILAGCLINYYNGSGK